VYFTVYGRLKTSLPTRPGGGCVAAATTTGHTARRVTCKSAQHMMLSAIPAEAGAVASVIGRHTKHHACCGCDAAAAATGCCYFVLQQQQRREQCLCWVYGHNEQRQEWAVWAVLCWLCLGIAAVLIRTQLDNFSHCGLRSSSHIPCIAWLSTVACSAGGFDCCSQGGKCLPLLPST
jgi:hypothetical protein